MSFCAISNEDKQYLEKLIKHLNFKCMQIVVQSRIGKPLRTKSCYRSELNTFRMTINDDPKVQKEVAAAFSGSRNLHGGLVAEISLHTNENTSLILEVWYLGLSKKCESVDIHHVLYNRMTMLLKSLLCLTRLTPAYRLAKQQSEEFVICYRIFRDNLDISGLGRMYSTMRVGSLPTPIGTLVLSVAYRTTENIHVSTKSLSEKANTEFEVKDDHFAHSRPHRVSPARPCHTLQTSRPRTVSEQSDGTGPPNIDNSPSFNVFNSSFSVSPNKYLGKNENNATFTVGTPPSANQAAYRSVSSPMLARQQRFSNQFDAKSRCIPSGGNDFHTSNCARVRSSSKPFLSKNYPPSGTSAPTEHHYYLHTGSIPNTENMINERRNSVPTNLSNSTNSVFAGKKANGHANAEVPECTRVVNLPESITPANSRPRPSSSSQTLLTGAFIAGTDSVATAQEKLSAVGSSNLPFLDLISAIDDNDTPDNLSQRSDSNASLGVNEQSRFENSKKSNLSKKHSSCSSLSSQESDCSSNSSREKQDPDDFVMVNVNPAFAKDSTCREVGVFYKECMNAPELVMFEENQANETDETLLDLTKQLEDYEEDMLGFDQFIQELNVK